MSRSIAPGKVVCVGRNYALHAQELGNPVPQEPLLFLKPPSAIIGSGESIRLPRESSNVEHEAEIALVVDRRLSDVSMEALEEGPRYIRGVACANDVTARDLQKLDGQWTRAKGFDTFLPLGEMAEVAEIGGLEIVCRVNGVEKQRGRVSEMVFSFPKLVSYISRIMTLEPGDLILTGTPAGTSRLNDKDLVEIEIPNVAVLTNPVELRDR